MYLHAYQRLLQVVMQARQPGDFATCPTVSSDTRHRRLFVACRLLRPHAIERVVAVAQDKGIRLYFLHLPRRHPTINTLAAAHGRHYLKLRGFIWLGLIKNRR